MKTINGSKLCEDMNDALQVIRRLADKNTHTWVYDIETTGLNDREDLIVGHVATFGPAPSDTYYIPVRHGENHEGNISEYRDRKNHPFEVHLNKVVSARRDLRSIGHHFLFDMMFCHHNGIEFIGDLEDTEVNAALLNEFAGSYSLENCCIAAGTEPKRGKDLYEYLASRFSCKPDRSSMAHYWKLAGNDKTGVDYAVGDGVSTWNLRENQIKLMDAQNLGNIYKLESDLTRTLYRMKKRGVKIDMDYLKVVEDETDKKITEALKVLPKDFNVRGPKQVRELMELHGHTDWPMTAGSKKFPNGQPSFKEEWLKTNEIGRSILVVRKWEHLRDSFINPLRERQVVNGRVHSTYHQMANDDFGTITGRLSCSNPNLQQVPKRNKEIAKFFRPLFIPDFGMDWWDADLSQCEPRLLAHYSGARALVDGYMSDPPVDAHQAVTNAVNAIGVMIDREDGKRLNQTLITGGGRGKIVKMLGDRGEEIYEGYFRAMPEIKDFAKKSSRVFEQRGYIISILGRRARIPSSDKGYLAMNRILQCGNADIVKRSMVEVDRLFEEDGDECALLNSVHDALSTQAEPKKKPLMLEALRIFTDFGPGRAIPMRVPLQADYGIGKNWGEATFPAEKLTFG